MTHRDVAGPYSNKKSICVLQISFIKIICVIGFVHCYIVNVWRSSFCNFLHGLAFVTFVPRIIWCCYLVIIMKHPSCRYKLRSLAPILDVFQQRSQYICYGINHCLGLCCYNTAAIESNNNSVLCFCFV